MNRFFDNFCGYMFFTNVRHLLEFYAELQELIFHEIRFIREN